MYALRQLVTVRPKVKLIVAGRGPIQEEMEALTQRLGLSGHVHFVGHVDAERRDLLYGIAEVAAFAPVGMNLLVSSLWKQWRRECR